MGMRISRKLRNLKDAATRPNVPFGTGGHKSLNLGYIFIILCAVFYYLHITVYFPVTGSLNVDSLVNSFLRPKIVP